MSATNGWSYHHNTVWHQQSPQIPPATLISHLAQNTQGDSFTQRVWQLWVPEQRRHHQGDADAACPGVRTPRTVARLQRSKVWHWISRSLGYGTLYLNLHAEPLWDKWQYKGLVYLTPWPNLQRLSIVRQWIAGSGLRDEYTWPQECQRDATALKSLWICVGYTDKLSLAQTVAKMWPWRGPWGGDYCSHWETEPKVTSG